MKAGFLIASWVLVFLLSGYLGYELGKRAPAAVAASPVIQLSA
jgi:hypothetical protein